MLAARVIALPPMVCFVRRQQILAVMHHVPSKMVLLSILKVVRAARVIALPPMVCFVRRHSILAISMQHVPLPMVSP